MKCILMIVLAALMTIACAAWAADGLISVKSPYPVGETVDRLQAGTAQRGLKVFARIDLAAGATSVGKNLRPTVLLIFGNPEGGTPLMQCVQTAGIDLPLKALAWQDGQGQVWLGYNDTGYLAVRHGITACPAVEPIRTMLSELVAEAVAQ